MLKRGMDILVSVLMLVMGLPFFLIVGLLIKMTDGGPVFFRQVRVGQGGRLFFMLKFRSMGIHAEKQAASLTQQNLHPGNIMFKMKNDPRVTWIGRLLRKTSVDEMPQLWNVIRGDMSLVGPRPPIPSEVERYTPFEKTRLGVKPGLTCLWQINGRSELPFSQQVDLDITYINNQSFIMDLKILLQTIPAVLSGKGAY